MSEQNNFGFSIRAINKNEQIKKLSTLGDRISDWVTAWAGSTGFLFLNILIFAAWILINTGQFGDKYIFDEYPFGMLTTAVSLEAIILAVFVLISQNRQSERSEIRSEMDYITDLQADAEINIIVSMLERIADKQNVDVSDLLAQLKVDNRKIKRDHPVSEEDVKLSQS